MMCGAFPPSSKVQRVSVSAPVFRIVFAVAPSPVKLILATSGWATSRAPASGPSPGTTLTTPGGNPAASNRSEEHTSELQSLMRISYAVFCLKKKKQPYHHEPHID